MDGNYTYYNVDIQPLLNTVNSFDFFHHGHANILRQAKQLFPSVYLIVGVHSDASILLNKGPSIMKQHERYQQVRACKWTDEVVEDAPYFTSLEMVKKWNVDFVVHGDGILILFVYNNN